MRLQQRVVRPAAAVVVALLCLPLLPGCDPTPTTPRWTETLLQLPESYRAEATGELRVGDLRFRGRVRADYLIYPGGGVVMEKLHAWVGDADVVTRFLFIETSRERLRCTEFSNDDLLIGSLDSASGELVFPPSAAALSGLSHTERLPDRSCPAPARAITAVNNSELRVTHEPDTDHFAVNTTFTARYDGNDVRVVLDATGSFLNRPPQPEIGIAGPGIPIDDVQGGCPVIAGNPPGAVPNDPLGLRLQLVSVGFDPDGSYRRADVIREEWSHADSNDTTTKFRFIGRGRVEGPYLFESGKDHWLMLTAWDRTGASTRALCHFRVLLPDEVPG